MPLTASRIEAGTRIDPTGFLHKHPEPPHRLFAPSDVPQCPRPFADCFTIGKISARAANNCSKWVRIPVEGQLRKIKCVSQKLAGLSPHFVMLGDCEYGF